jgi:hypothetical protein
LGKQILVMREKTERPEGIETGLVSLVGTDPNLICTSLDQIIDAAERTRPLDIGRSVYGDGKASERIVAALTGDLPAEAYSIGGRVAGLVSDLASIRERNREQRSATESRDTRNRQQVRRIKLKKVAAGHSCFDGARR